MWALRGRLLAGATILGAALLCPQPAPASLALSKDASCPLSVGAWQGAGEPDASLTPCGRDDTAAGLVLGPDVHLVPRLFVSVPRRSAAMARMLEGTGVEAYMVLAEMADGDAAEEPGIAEIAEPATLAVFGLGLVGLGLARRRRQRSRRHAVTPRPPRA